MTATGYRVGIDGATGLVGRELAAQLAERGFPLAQLLAYGDEAELGDAIEMAGREVAVRGRSALGEQPLDVLFIAPPAPLPARGAPRAARLVIDGTGLARQRDAGVPLALPQLGEPPAPANGWLAVPSPAAAALAAALAPLQRAVGVVRVSAVVLESMSRHGAATLELFTTQVHRLLNGHEELLGPLQGQLGFNVVPHVDAPALGADGSLSPAEERLAGELAALLPDLGPVAAVSLLVPVFYGLGAVLFCELARPLALDAARELLSGAPGLMVLDERARPPASLREVIGSDATMVGRLRRDPTLKQGLILWVALDSQRAGAALCMLQVAEQALARERRTSAREST